ncbi:Ig-like domain-containing protein [Emticicia fontis]
MPLQRWDKSLGGNEGEIGFCVELADDGGYVMAATTQSSIGGDKQSASRGGDDFWIIKINQNGERVWDKTYGGSLYDYVRTIAKCKDGGFLIGGDSSSPQDGDKSEPAHPYPNGIPSNDYWVVKIDANGNKQWDKRFGGNGFDYLWHIIQTSDGGYLLGGTSDSNDGGEKTENLRYGRDAWVIKIDANGNKQWDKTLGGSGYESAEDLLELPDKSILVACNSFGEGTGGDMSAPIKGGSDIWLVKLSEGGSIIWNKRYGSTGEERYPSMVLTNDGNVFFTAGINGPQNGDVSSEPIGFDDFWLIKIDYNGNKIWDKRYGGYNSENMPSIYKTFDKKYLLAGQTYSQLGYDITDYPHSSNDLWVLKIDDDGNKYWDKRIGCNDLYTWGRSILKPTPDLGFVFAGTSNAAISGDKTENSLASDIWVVKTGVNDFVNPLCTQPNRELAFVANGCNGTINWFDGSTGPALVAKAIDEPIIASATCTENANTSAASSFRVNVALYQHYITETIQNDNKTFNAMTTIEANNLIIAPVDVKYIAGNSIQLNPGFKADSGSIFSATIKSCFE